MTKLKKIQLKIFFSFFDQKLQFTYKDDQATGDAFSPQKRTASTSKNEILPLGFGSGSGSALI
jgi:hypothetical protein